VATDAGAGAAGTPATAAAPTAAAPPPAAQTTYSINRQAGVISVFATTRQHKLVRAYLSKMLASATAQVLIEAKVVEIALTDAYSAGVDWVALQQKLHGSGFGISSYAGSTDPSATIPASILPGNLPNPFGGNGLNLGFTTSAGNLAAMVNLIKTFGDTKTLSSPRLTVMNNHTAMLKVAENHIYYKLQATVTATPAAAGASASQTATYSSQLQTLPIGLVMTVQPSIDIDREQITLGLRPTVTAWPGNSVSDPAVSLSLASACGSSTSSACSTANISEAIASSSVPVIDVREMDSVVTVPSGAVIVMGGLMQEISLHQKSGVPGAADVPVVGNLFTATSEKKQMTELVVFLKATLVRGEDSIDWADRDLYKNHIHDPHPLGF
jgi:general secretion pathway protein D